MKLKLTCELSDILTEEFFGEGETFLQAFADLEKKVGLYCSEQSGIYSEIPFNFMDVSTVILDFQDIYEQFAAGETIYHLRNLLVSEDYCTLEKL